MNNFNDPRMLVSETSAVERFLKYVEIETTSDAASDNFPSSKGQLLLAEKLVAELKALGVTDAFVDTNGYVSASIAGTSKTTLCLIAHLDTSDAFSGAGVQPLVHKDYQLGDICLKNEVTISPTSDARLAACKGHDIVTADGTTLLGADDKAGIAIIMGIVEYIQHHSHVARPNLKICFTPDEEIGRGADRFPFDRIGADFAITVDGTFAGELNVETFEAHSVAVSFQGVSIHPGYAKGKLVNALRHAAAFIEALPKEQSPEHTANREGFIHPISVNGDATAAAVELIVRDFTEDGVNALLARVQNIAAQIQAAESRLKVKFSSQFSYPNMFKYVQQNRDLVTNMKMAIEKSGVVPSVVPIRGGTDGANLSRCGLVTPNLFTGGINLHGPREWISTTNMGYSFCSILNLMQLYAS